MSDLDPKDWNDFRKTAHAVLDACVDRMAGAREKPWQPLSDEAKAGLMPALPRDGKPLKDAAKALVEDVMPHATGNTHPRFWGWVHGTGLANNLISDMVASAMNSNCGGRDHGAFYVERAVIGWCREIFDFPAEASGVLTGGTSQATVIALQAARLKTLGLEARQDGVDAPGRMITYCADGTHACVANALEIIGHGSASLRKIAGLGASGGMDVDALAAAIAEDRAAGLMPFCVVGTAGSVNTGAFDDLHALADLCADEGVWLHVDGAFGAWARIADAPYCDLVDGIERADSLAFDFHKWMSVNYDCGAVLIRDGAHHYDSFANRPAYLAEQAEGLGGGGAWPCDFGIDLSRGFRALKVWSALQEHGLDAFGAAITKNCKQAAYMAKLVDAAEGLTLAAPVVANVCVFYAEPDEKNAQIVQRLQREGLAVFSTTTIEGRICIRAAIVNHRTNDADIKLAIDAVLAAL